MRFKVSHTTSYRYRNPASESYAELRVWPRDNRLQKVSKRQVNISPNVPVKDYLDYYGNHVEYFSVPFRHDALVIKASAEVETFSGPDLSNNLETCIGECRQIFNSSPHKIFDFLHETEKIPFLHIQLPQMDCSFRSVRPIGEALLELNQWIYKNFKYEPGATDVGTPLPEVIAMGQGVCQDFAHLMLAIIRHHGLPCRYVSGYIESHDPEVTDSKLVGAAASHAWVEVLLPGGIWWGLDPTNNQVVGERHVTVAVGRDYDDVAPMRGTFRGAQNQKLQVIVSLKRKP